MKKQIIGTLFLLTTFFNIHSKDVVKTEVDESHSFIPNATYRIYVKDDADIKNRNAATRLEKFLKNRGYKLSDEGFDYILMIYVDSYSYQTSGTTLMPQTTLGTTQVGNKTVRSSSTTTTAVPYTKTVSKEMIYLGVYRFTEDKPISVWTGTLSVKPRKFDENFSEYLEELIGQKEIDFAKFK